MQNIAFKCRGPVNQQMDESFVDMLECYVIERGEEAPLITNGTTWIVEPISSSWVP